MSAADRPSAAASRDERPTLVMLHGFALDSRMWRRQVDVLGEHYRILTLDLPGFGPQARELGEVEAAAAVKTALDAVRVEEAHLLANSFGAAVATDFALQHPSRVRSLTLMGPLLLGRRTGIEAWSRCVALAAEGDRATAAEIWLDDPLFEGIRNDEELFEELRQIVLDYGGGHWTGKVIAKWSNPDPIPALKKLEIPALVVSGEMDIPSFIQMAEAYARALPRARREIVQAAGHLPNIEQPDQFNAILLEFLAAV
ncbi:MAG: alpha/beta fold hydrolase [Deltaproteobacteria bacterium]|nr:alpha/beta fold hydrolase [Deltaproteobacteria bacterium]